MPQSSDALHPAPGAPIRVLVVDDSAYIRFTLREIMTRFPRPVVMLSSLTTEGANETIQALTLGAVDFAAKPETRANMGAIMDEVIAKVRGAALARIRGGARPGPVASSHPPAERRAAPPAAGPRIKSSSSAPPPAARAPSTPSSKIGRPTCPPLWSLCSICRPASPGRWPSG